MIAPAGSCAIKQQPNANKTGPLLKNTNFPEKQIPSGSAWEFDAFTMIVALRLCRLHDIKELHGIAMQSYCEHYLYLWENESYARWYMNRSFSTASLLEQMQDPQSSFYFIEHESRNCGFVKLNWERSLQQQTASMELERMYLLREASGKGVGSAAMQLIFILAREKGKKMIWLKAMDSSPSVSFYEKAGFQKTATERLPFEGFRDTFRNMWLMEKTV